MQAEHEALHTPTFLARNTRNEEKQILPIVIGAVLLFGAVALVGILENVGKQFK